MKLPEDLVIKVTFDEYKKAEELHCKELEEKYKDALALAHAWSVKANVTEDNLKTVIEELDLKMKSNNWAGSSMGFYYRALGILKENHSLHKENQRMKQLLHSNSIKMNYKHPIFRVQRKTDLFLTNTTSQQA